MVFRIILLRLMVIVCNSLLFRSLNVEPEMYARNAGLIGKIQGATNEPRPASAAIARVISAMNHRHNFSIKGFFQIIPFWVAF